MIEKDEHAPIAPSSLGLTVKCPGSVKLQKMVPQEPETEEQAEGNAAHYVALVYARGGARFLPIGAKFKVGKKPREWEVDADMAAGATLYANAIGGFHNELRTEDPVIPTRIHPVHCAGTPDARRFYPDARAAFATCPPEMSPEMFSAGHLKLLRVADYKYGHRYVEAFGNYQMIAYAVGALERMQLDDLDPNLWVELMIVQPRCYTREGPVRSWLVQASALRPFVNIASNKAHEALGDDPPCYTNDSCIDCRARHVCKTLQYATGAFIDFSTSAELVEMPHEAIGAELAMVEDAIDRLKARATGLAAQAETLIRQGKPVAFFHMEPGQSRLAYKDDVNVDEVIGLGELIGIDLRKPQTKKDSLLTPTQAIQMGVDENVMKIYAHRPPAALKLTRDDSTTLRKVFAK